MNACILLPELVLWSVVLTATSCRVAAGSAISGIPTSEYHRIHVNFDKVTSISKTTATLQVVSNPILDKKYSPVAETLFDNLGLLQADLVRYAAWFPYPTIGVAELEPPTATTTSWKFGDELQQQFLDVWHAVRPHGRVVITFSTQPAWMFNTTDWSYSNDTSRSDWQYAKGTWMPSTTTLVADYYARFSEWLVKGEFQDELGNTIGGGPNLGVGANGGVTHWEIFNEPEAEHRLTPPQYNLLYDAIVKAIRAAVDPNHTIQFFGMALSGHQEWKWWKEFLTLSNHDVETRDAVQQGYASFHFYASPSSRTNVSTFLEVWPQLDHFLEEVDEIIKVRDALSPSTKLAVNEAGVIPPNDNEKGVPESPPVYYNMAAALYIVLLSELAQKGVDVVGSSQFCGCPEMPLFHIPDRQYPGVSMTNWTTGSGNPRYWALKMINEHTNVGDRIMHVSAAKSSSQKYGHSIYVQGRISEKGERVVILVNKSDQTRATILPSTEHDGCDPVYHISVVDESSRDGPWADFKTTNKTLVLRRFAVAVIQIEGKSILPNDGSWSPQLQQ